MLCTNSFIALRLALKECTLSPSNTVLATYDDDRRLHSHADAEQLRPPVFFLVARSVAAHTSAATKAATANAGAAAAAPDVCFATTGSGHVVSAAVTAATGAT